MKISDIDKNLAVESGLNLSDAVWFDSKEAPFRIHGLARAEHDKLFLRMPRETAKATSTNVYLLNQHTTLRLATTSLLNSTLLVKLNSLLQPQQTLEAPFLFGWTTYVFPAQL